jgi:DNA mismatch repair ATPase MutS
VLTAPNMAGKSSLMRATTVATLLGNAGLFAPVASGSVVPRYDPYDLPHQL